MTPRWRLPVAGLTLAWAAATGVTAGMLLPSGPARLAAGAGTVAVAARWLMVPSERRVTATVGVAALCLLGAGLARGAADRSLPVVTAGAVQLAGSVREVVTSGAVVDVAQAAGAEPLAVRSVFVPLRRGVAVEPGETVEVDAAGLREPSSRPGPASRDSLARYDVQAVAAGAQLFHLADPPWWERLLGGARARATAAIEAALPAPAAALLLGVGFGLHRPIDTATRSALQDAGLIHIVAVSGLKVVIVAALLGALLARSVLGRGARAALTLGGVAGYVCLSGGGPAAVRSGLTAAAGLALGRDSRQPYPFVVLGLCASLMLLASPAWIHDVGFQLSVLGTAGILLLADPLARRIPGPALLVEPFAVTVAAQLATVPVMAGTFGSLSLVGPLANALVLPLLPLLIVLGWLGVLAAAISPALGALPLGIAGVGCGAITVIARILTSVPGAAVHISRWPAAWSAAELAGILAFLAVLWLPRPRRPGA